MGDLVKDWTLFNWLALVAFAFACISVLNALLSLRSRYKDWRATKTKQAFKARVKELLSEMDRIEKYHENPSEFVLDIVQEAIPIIVVRIFSAAFMMMALCIFIIASTKLSSRHILFAALFALMVATGTLLKPLDFLTKLYKSLRNFRRPDLMVSELDRLFTEGVRKGFTTREEMATTLNGLNKRKIFGLKGG